MEFRGLNVKQKQISLCVSAKEIQTLKPKNIDSIGGGGDFNYSRIFDFLRGPWNLTL